MMAFQAFGMRRFILALWHGTREGLLFRMDFHVLGYVRFASRMIIAHNARVRFVSRMYVGMPFQTGQFAGLIAAHGASIFFLYGRRVNHTMACQCFFAIAFIAAHRA